MICASSGAQESGISSDILIKIVGAGANRLAVAEFRGNGVGTAEMSRFQEVLWGELQESGAVQLSARSVCPAAGPQTWEDLTPDSANAWRTPPCAASFLAFGYAAAQNGRLVVFGWLSSLAGPQASQVFGRVYHGDLSPQGAALVARRFAADILQSFGSEPLSRSQIFFVSDRTGHKEIWRMNHDGSAQRQVTAMKSITFQPAVSRDGRWLAYTTLAGLKYEIRLQPADGGRARAVGHPRSALNHTPSFSPDGTRLYFSASVEGWSNLFTLDLADGKLHRLTTARAVEVEPRPNPKAPETVVFTSGRSGRPQLYSMTGEGLDVSRVTTGVGQAVNPNWHPDGQHLAFAWTNGYEPGNFHVFIMDFRSRMVVQLTRGEEVSENPVWASTGRHLAYAVRQRGTSQVWSMLADGSNQRQLTAFGSNSQPVWARIPAD
ncbi:MAG: hypothetical protein K2X35_03805 [Bryobacteraceae bacterium]|nr:hypothetical protein [Bryobacteraceae bacterium]